MILLLDPFLFACPEADDGREECAKFLNALLSWRAAARSALFDVYSSRDSFAVLDRAARYPLWDAIEAALVTGGMTEVETKDIVRLINALLLNTRTVEDALKLDACLLEGEINPGAPIAGRSRIFSEALIQLSVLGLLLQEIEEVDTGPFVATRLDGGAHEVNVEAVVVDYEPVGVLPRFAPCPVSGRVVLGSSPESLDGHMDCVGAWRSATDEAARIGLLRLYVERHASGEQDRAAWQCGPRFLETAEKYGFLTGESKIAMLLRACAEVILGERMRDTHALREGPGPEEPQVRRGADTAWRRDINHEFHLHYWRTESGIEFASIVVHNDFSIPQ